MHYASSCSNLVPWMKNKQNLRPIQNFLPGWIYSIEKRRYKMPTYTVTKTDVSSKGKPRVYFDNRHAWQDAYYVSPNIQSPEVGMTIEADTASQTFAGAKGATWFLNGWKPKDVSGLAPSVVQEYREKIKPSKGWAIEPGDLSRFASNVVGSAIAANLIKTPTDLHPWIATAYSALQGLREGKPVDFEDKFPMDFVESRERDNEDDRFDGDPGPAADDIPF